MKDFINKLELAFDKQLADKTNYGRNQVKELFLRACIEVLAEKPEYIGKASDFEHIQKVDRVNRVNETPSKEEGEKSHTQSSKVLRRPKHKVSSFKVNAVEDAVFIQYAKVLGDNQFFFEVFSHDMEFVCDGWTSIDNPDEHDMLQLYNHWINEIPF
jgi:hypothetical protein